MTQVLWLGPYANTNVRVAVDSDSLVRVEETKTLDVLGNARWLDVIEPHTRLKVLEFAFLQVLNAHNLLDTPLVGPTEPVSEEPPAPPAPVLGVSPNEALAADLAERAAAETPETIIDKTPQA